MFAARFRGRISPCRKKPFKKMNIAVERTLQATLQAIGKKMPLTQVIENWLLIFPKTVCGAADQEDTGTIAGFRRRPEAPH
jgi:hypothetical protein